MGRARAPGRQSPKKAAGKTDGLITLEYDLPSLPTAQHKAGLAGLLLVIEAMRRRGLGPLPDVTDVSHLGCKVTFGRESLQAVFDDLYDASEERASVKRKWKGAEPIAVDEVVIIDEGAGNEKREKRYVYNVVVPRAGFLEALGLTGKGHWIKLWRDTIWGTFRSIPKTREAYQDRAAGNVAARAGISKVWPELERWAASLSSGKKRVVSVPSSLMLGAQDHNAERVGFTDSAAQALLLHFWPVVMVTYVAQVVDLDGKESIDSGYAVTIPEVVDLVGFLEDFVAVLGERDNSVVGYRPSDSLICVPEEGALEFASQLLARAQRRSASSSCAATVSAIEVSHLQKKGNSLMTLSYHRLEPSSEVLRDFEHIRKTYRSPLLRAHFIRNLVAGRQWFSGFERLAARLPAKLFVWKSKGPWTARQFVKDANSKFRSVAADFEKGE